MELVDLHTTAYLGSTRLCLRTAPRIGVIGDGRMKCGMKAVRSERIHFTAGLLSCIMHALQGHCMIIYKILMRYQSGKNGM